jgi:hypothetical protein
MSHSRLPSSPAASLCACVAAALLGVPFLLCAPAEADPAAAAPARSAPGAATQAGPAAQPQMVAPFGAAGLVISIDPVTGRPVLPTAAERLALTPQERTGLLRTSAGLAEVRLPNGAVMVDLQGRFMDFTVVQIGPLGRPLFRCVHDERALRRLLVPLAATPHLISAER